MKAICQLDFFVFVFVFVDEYFVIKVILFDMSNSAQHFAHLRMLDCITKIENNFANQNVIHRD